MIPFIFDTETHPIKPGLQSPPVVCGQWGGAEGPITVELARDFRPSVEAALRNPEYVLVAHFAAFDACTIMATWPDLIPLFFAAYRQNRVLCTKVREKLFRIAQGTDKRFGDKSLVGCADRYDIAHSFKVSEDGHKEEYWRTRYELLKDTPVEEWPPDALRYAKEDIRALREVLAAQTAKAPANWLLDQFRQSRADLWLRLISCHGLRIDQAHALRFSQKVETEAVVLRQSLTELGLVKPDGVRDTKAAKRLMVERRLAQDLPLPITKKGKSLIKDEERNIRGEVLAAYELGPLPKKHTKEEKAARDAIKYVGTDADACKATGHQALKDYARFGSVKTLRSRVARLRAAGDLPIQPRFDVLKETGRTSSSSGETKPGQPIMAYGDQVQNLNREAGLRECYVPRAGHWFLASDWAAAELHTLAQVCLYYGLDSNLAKVLNSGKDVHMWFGSQMKGWDYAWAQEARKGLHGPEAKAAAKKARQMAKAANFGFPGGLGVETFRLFAAKTYEVILSDAEARELKAAWFAAFPEMIQYFDLMNGIIKSGEPLHHFKSDRYRGSLTYCSACNSPFQGMASDMAKEAGFDLAEACYVEGVDPVLFGCRVVNFIHDEFVLEVPIERAHECAMRVVEVMEDAGREWCPDVNVRAEPALSLRWRKAAEPEYLDGRLIPWEHRPQGSEEPSKEDALAKCGGDRIIANWTYGREY